MSKTSQERHLRLKANPDWYEDHKKYSREYYRRKNPNCKKRKV